MRAMLLIVIGLFAGSLAIWQPAQAQSLKEEVVELQITPSFTPEDLGALVQKLGKRGILLRFEETGYCNGELRILKGEIIGSDGSRQGFETQALRQLNIQLEARTKALGIRAVKVKSRFKKCHPRPIGAPKNPDEEAEDTRPIRQI